MPCNAVTPPVSPCVTNAVSNAVSNAVCNGVCTSRRGKRKNLTPLSLGYVSVDAARGSLTTGEPRR